MTKHCVTVWKHSPVMGHKVSQTLPHKELHISANPTTSNNNMSMVVYNTKTVKSHRWFQRWRCTGWEISGTWQHAAWLEHGGGTLHQSYPTECEPEYSHCGPSLSTPGCSALEGCWRFHRGIPPNLIDKDKQNKKLKVNSFPLSVQTGVGVNLNK